ncbi:MAG TPA: hypothetical protein VM097_13055 [Mycobacteriales bacterium]|nr:hypothetical protein [Mycobacteriales bacterium]
MSDQDDLRVRLARLDPAASLDAESPRAPELLERIMSAPVLPDTDTVPAPAGRPRRTALAWAAAAALVAGGVTTAVALQDDGAAPAKQKTSVALSLPPSGVMSSCIPFSVAVLRDMSPAFAATVSAVDGERVVLDVDHWYAGGTADQVVLDQPGGNTSVALDGVAFEQGKRYLVTAAQGTVNGCGYSGPATADLEASFTEAFGR